MVAEILRFSDHQKGINVFLLLIRYPLRITVLVRISEFLVQTVVSIPCTKIKIEKIIIIKIDLKIIKAFDIKLTYAYQSNFIFPEKGQRMKKLSI